MGFLSKKIKKHIRNKIPRLAEHFGYVTSSPICLKNKKDKKAHSSHIVPAQEYKDFVEVYQAQKHYSSNPDFVRIFFLHERSKYIIENNIQGDFAELGVYRGHTARVLLDSCGSRTLRLFDTFQGHPDNACADQDGELYVDHIKQKTLSDTSEAEVRNLLGHAKNLVIHKGFFPESAAECHDLQFAFVHLDADQYESTLEGFRFFYPRLSPGGVMICHDYGRYQGVRKAVNEFRKLSYEHPILLPDSTGSIMFIKSV